MNINANRRRFARSGVVVSASALCLGTLGMFGAGVAGAASPARVASPSHHSSHSPVGVYKQHNSDGAKGILTVKANNTWSALYGSLSESGYWVSRGNAIALTSNQTQLSDLGCLLYGTINANGIGTARNLGFYNCPGGVGTWYASTGKAKAPPKAGKSGSGPHAAGSYSYNDSFGDSGEGLTVNANISAHEGTITFSSNCSGEWVQQYSTIAMNINGNCGGESWVYLGTVTAGGLSSAASPGHVTFDGSTGTWYGVRD